MVQENVHVKIDKQMKETSKMTFEEANERYLDILKRISHVENPAEKENMYNLARLTVGMSINSCRGIVKPDTESEITSFEKMLSIVEANHE